MFGKPHDIDSIDTLDSAIDEFFGDEAAAAEAVEVHVLQERVEQAESQINSQFTSLATYAQIAQEQVELARAEAKAATERSEQRVTSLIERERADRISSFTGSAPAGSAPDVSARIDAVEHSIAQIRKGLDECLERQKSLAEAITMMFERLTATPPAPLIPDDNVPADASGADNVGGDGATHDAGVDSLHIGIPLFEAPRIDEAAIAGSSFTEPPSDHESADEVSADEVAIDEAPATTGPDSPEPAPLAPPSIDSLAGRQPVSDEPPALPTSTSATPLSGPIADLSLNG